METKKKITISDLTEDFVNVKVVEVAEINSEDVEIGKPFRVSYSNSEADRERLSEHQPAQIINAVMAIWGDTPTVVAVQPAEVEQQPTEQQSEQPTE